MEITHIFERAGLGKAPFRYIGSAVLKFQAAPGEPTKPGGSCDYCGMAIMYACRIRGADGREFKVGETCVAKTGDRGLKAKVDRDVAKAKKAAKGARDASRIAQTIAGLARLETRRVLRALPHGQAWAATTGLTALDQVVWLFRKGGTSGKIRACRIVDKSTK